MLLVAPVRPERRLARTQQQNALHGIEKLNVPRSDIPAVTHVDYSARIQTVHSATNDRFHRLLGAMKARTGTGVLVNTSFNVRDEPIVCSPDDAYRCFMATEMDVLVLGNAILRKEEQLSPPVTSPSSDALIPARLVGRLDPAWTPTAASSSASRVRFVARAAAESFPTATQYRRCSSRAQATAA